MYKHYHTSASIPVNNTKNSGKHRQQHRYLFFSSIYHYLFFLSSNNLSDPTIQLLLFSLFIHHRRACNAVQAHTSPAASLRRYPWLLCVLDLGNCPKTPTPSPTKTKLQYCSAASPSKNENTYYRSSQQSPLKGPLTHGHFKEEDDCPVCVKPLRSSNMGRLPRNWSLSLSFSFPFLSFLVFLSYFF